MAGKKKRKSKRRKRKRRFPSRWRRRLLTAAGVLLTLGVIAGGLLLHLYVEITTTFESRLFKTPTTIHSAPLVLGRGSRISVRALAGRLDRCGYGRIASDPGKAGQYRIDGRFLDVFLRPLDAPAGELPARYRSVQIRNGVLESIRDRQGRRRGRLILEPELLATLYGAEREEREVLPFERFPEPFLKAVLAAEDARFFTHRGVDLRAIARAAWANLRSGRIVQGGSTISQQTVKNLFLDHRRTWWRKIREIPMAVILDLHYPKERILEVYLNEVYLGQRGSVSICGAQAASRFYFGRDLVDLSLGEWAMLAGMIRSPGNCNPFVHPDRAAGRRDQVLDAMLAKEWVDGAEVDRARNRRPALGSGEGGFTRARYVVDLVRTDLERNFPEGTLQEAGLRVYTTLDTVLQGAVDGILESHLKRLEKRTAAQSGHPPGTLQGAVVVTDPRTGAILAMAGGRDYGETQFNRAVMARRQPGSCFKPFVYLAGLEAEDRSPGDGLTLATVLDDSPLTIRSGGKLWTPSNHDRSFRGPVSAREALEQSLNVPTVRAAEKIGLDRIIRTARRCGLAGEMKPYPSLALGAQEVSPLELATAYGTLAAGGVRAVPRIIEEVRDETGERVERRATDRKRAVSPRSAFLVNDVLQGVLTEGTARTARVYGYTGDAAGKTGTTDDTRDAWFVGYTPEILALVWVGYDDNAGTGLGGATGALPIWVDVMQEAEVRGISRPFRRPDGVEQARIDPASGKRAVSGCPRVEAEWFASGTEPEDDCPLHRKRGIRNWFRKVFGKDRNRSG